MLVGRWGEPRGHNPRTGDDNSVVDCVDKLGPLDGHVGSLDGVAHPTQPLDRAGWFHAAGLAGIELIAGRPELS